MREVPFLFTLTLLACSSFACQGSSRSAVQPLEPKLLGDALTTYVDIAHATYDDSVQSARHLHACIEELIERPSPATLERARSAWLSARTWYAQSEVFRFYDGPIDEVELAVNTWPIDESFVESLSGEPTLGIINDVARYPQLSRELLLQLNGRDGETAISTGYHVIELLLWGRDDQESGPGARSYQDYVSDGHEKRLAELARRRGVYLRLATELLVAQLTQVRDAFRPGQDNYRRKLLAGPANQALYRAVKGMAKLSGPELSGERLTVPYETKDQENEHSCFSDSTHADLLHNARGLENVCLGRYRRASGELVQGAGLCQVLASSTRAAKGLRASIQRSVQQLAAIPAPFDRAILGDDSGPSRRSILSAIRSLREQAELLEQARRELSLSEPMASSRP